jgi:hypothetical protein
MAVTSFLSGNRCKSVQTAGRNLAPKGAVDFLQRCSLEKRFEQEPEMARYYFNVVTSTETIEDPEGTQLPSIEAARVEAIEDARQLMASAMLSGHNISTRRIEITDDYGLVLLAIPFTDAYTTEI